ncbi:MAG: hypothetical protein EOO46_19275 [Flavobacterium sp.]|nr:MAG: hypothetical protein EOO46_19275 [Flavobacterium sp.]
MNIFALEKFDDEGHKCTFYTVRLEDARYSETDKFFIKYAKSKKLKKRFQELAVFLTKKIGNEWGALEEFFRFENKAQALPPPGEHVIDELTINYAGFPLRLYCLRMSDSLVVLFNGAEKTSSTAQGGMTSMAFHEANNFATRITKALQDGDIYITSSQREFLTFNHSQEIFL